MIVTAYYCLTLYLYRKGIKTCMKLITIIQMPQKSLSKARKKMVGRVLRNNTFYFGQILFHHLNIHVQVHVFCGYSL